VAHSTNKIPAPGDAVLTYKHRELSHEDRPTGVVDENSGPAVGGGYYVILATESVIVVENYDEEIEAWVEKRPRQKPG
jgi:hypothetical protein